MFPFLEGVNSREDELAVKREASIRRIREVSADLTIYTDGSATAGIFEGGSGVVITRGDAEHPEVLEIIKRKGAAYTCSYEEEVEAGLTAAAWIGRNCKEEEKVLICTDSQSLCMALNSFNMETSPFRSAIHNKQTKIITQWIPGHSDVPGNEMADKAAKEGADLETAQRPISYRSACMMIKKSISYPTSHPVMKKVYQHYSTEKEKEEITTRKDQVLLAQLRSGKHKAFATYQHMLDETKPATCPRCTSGEEHTLEHWFMRCAGTMAAKHDIMYDEKVEEGLALLTKCPAKSLALAKRTLFGAD